MSAPAPDIPLGLGCELLGGTDWGPVDVEQTLAAVRFAWDSGIEVYDTADAYGLGLSETRLADALGEARHAATIVTKFGVRWEEASTRARTWRDNSPNYLATALEASLRRLRLERIPVYLVHWPDGATPLEDVLGALTEQQLRGKIGAFGLSNFGSDSVLASADAGASVVELPLSLVERQRVDDFAAASSRGISTIAYGVYAQGLLTGKYDRAARFGSDDRRHRLPQFASDRWEDNHHLLARLQAAAEQLDAWPSEVAMAWALLHDVDVALFGARTPAHVESALRAAALSLPADIDELLDLPTTWPAQRDLLQSTTESKQGRGEP